MRSSSIRRSAATGALAAAMLLAVTACSSTGSTESAATLSPQAIAASPTDPAGGLAVAQSAKLGAPVVTDANGWVLYRFDKDTTAPPASNCIDTCATTWPPEPAASDTQIKGVDANLVGSVKRADGTLQATLGGWPLYRYSGDKTAGDTNGQTVGGVWFVSGPDGTKAGVTASASPTT
jgi:predicted lipoprotein with Yx(FWY)xxD motif